MANSAAFYGQNFNTVKAGLTGISGAATTYSTGATALSFAVNGKAVAKSQVSGGASPTTGAVSGAAITLTAGKARAVVWGFDASGTIKVVEGPIVDLDSANAFIDAQPPQFGAVPDTICPFAYTLHKAGSTTVGTWTFGSSNWNATGMVHTVVDILTLPDRPQTA
jgi:hypothetical protein